MTPAHPPERAAPPYADTVAAGRSRLAEALAGDPDLGDVLDRYDRWADDLAVALAAVYPVAEVLPRVVDLVAAAHLGRSARLRGRDRQRLLNPDWFQRSDALGYAAYADRFAGTLRGVGEHIPYLSELGVTYLHLMPLLQPRPAPNDGGYAVADYRAVRSDLGTMADLERLAEDLHEAGISLTLDLVLNHVAREHAWAEAARAGDPHYRDYFYVFPDRTVPDRYERTLPEVFPAFAPGNFTWDDDLSGWVWTTFNSWQWDVNWANPDVFCEYADIVLYLANRGVDCLRLDAIAFTWKRMGTDCQNQPEVHDLTQALRAIAHMAAPSLVFKAEAIVGPDQLVAYLGTGAHAGRVSDLAYHNSLMVQIWSSLATRDARLMAQALKRFPVIPVTASWATYLRCHDDIGWAIDDADAAAVGWNGYDHRAFLSRFYTGEFPGTFARGAEFQPNELTGDRRVSGSAASLAGVEIAWEHGDPAALDLAIGRLLCGYAMVLGFGGLPLLYMGDELGLLNDLSYLDEPPHRDDNRWMHRPPMPWHLVQERHDHHTVMGRVFSGVRHLVAVRRATEALHASVGTTVLAAADPAVAVFVRRHAAATVVELFNLSEQDRAVHLDEVAAYGVGRPFDLLHDRVPEVHDGWIHLPPYAVRWLVDESRSS
ncbi:MAG: alpha-amylase family glycosyl hydrolase [Candidatus Nanopelagicales bacterium]